MGKNSYRSWSPIVWLSQTNSAPMIHCPHVFSKTMSTCWHHLSLHCSTSPWHLALSRKYSTYITPRLKKASLNRADGRSCRPIYNLPVLSKTLERLLARKLLDHLSLWRLMPDLQSAYRANHSTETAMLRVSSDITLRCDLDLWPCDLDLWPSTWTFVAYRLWRDETLHQTGMQSNNSRRIYCDFSVWPYDLGHVLSVALGSWIIFTSSDLRQLIRAWIIAFLCWYVMSRCGRNLWPADLKSSWYIKRHVHEIEQ